MHSKPGSYLYVQARHGVYPHPVVHDEEHIGTLPTPEVLAGQELRRLRTVCGWSQEEVARRMADYGYDWHQTTVGRTETATRPLRLNEAVALAALFGIPVTQMIAPMTLEAPDVEAEIDAELKHWREISEVARVAKATYEWTREEARSAEKKLTESLNEAERTSARLNYLHGLRAIAQGKPVNPEVAAKITAQYAREQEAGE